MAKKIDPHEASPVTVYMPKWLIEKIDEAARREHRSRTRQLLAIVERAFGLEEVAATSSK